MIIKTVELENIRSYKSQSVSFSQGSTLLSGDIGSGKSTLLLAIEFVFFGLQRSELEGVALLRNGTSKGSVSCQFEHNGHTYQITRRLQRSKKTVTQGTGFFKKDGQLEELTTSEISQRVIELFEYPQLTQKTLSQIFRFTVYCPQEHMKEILLENPAQRLQTIRSIFGIDSYKVIKENATTLIRHSKEIVARLEGETQDLVDIEKQVREQNEQIELLSIEIKDISNNAQTQEEEEKKLQKKVMILQEQKEKSLVQQKEIESLEKDIIQRKEDVLSVQKKIQVLEQKKAIVPKQVEFSQEKYSQAQLEVTNQTKLLFELERKKAISDNELSQSQKRKIDLERQLRQYQEQEKKKEMIVEKITQLEQISSQKEQLDFYQQKIDSLQQKKSIISERMNELLVEKLSFDECPTCKQPVTEEHKEHILKDQLAKKEEQEKMLAQLSQSIEHVRSQRKDIEVLHQKYEDAQKKLIELKTNLDYANSHKEQAKVVQKEYDELLVKQKTIQLVSQDELQKQKNVVDEKTIILNELTEQKKRYDESIEQIKQSELLAKEIDLLQTQMSQYESKKEYCEKELTQKKEQKIVFDNEEFIQIQSSHNQKKIQLSQVKELLSAKKSQEIQLQVFLRSQQKQLDHKQKSLQVLAKTRTQQTWLKQAFVPLMDVLEKALLKNIQQEFSQLFSQWFSLLIEDESMSASLSDDFSPIIIQNGYEMQSAHLSGGEKTSIALAYRLALNKVINTVHATIQTKDLLILDEPTDGFSTEQLDRVRIVLDTLGVKQLLIVSHEQKMHGFVDRVITMRKELNETSIQSD